jgi:predicted HTH domain antitoxin
MRRRKMALQKLELTFPAEVLASLATTYQDSATAIKEAAVLELYREGKISGGKAAEILNMERFEFIKYAGLKGIAYIRISPEELNEEVQLLQKS